jgi:hypothetical protein
MELTVKNTRQYVAARWRILTAILVGILAVCFIMLFRLGSITGHLSPEETTRQLFASSWHHLVNDPLYLPQSFVQWLILTIIPHHGLTVTRAASPVFGVLSLIAFAYVLRRWYGVRSAVYGTILFGLSSWLLHVSRYAGPQVLYLWALPTLLALTIAWERHKVGATHYLLIAVLATLLYVPGVIWLLLVVLALQPQLFAISWRKLSNPFGRIGGLILFLVLVAPLAYALISHPALSRNWLGLPSHFASLNVLAHNALHSVSFFVFRGPADATVWLPRLPILDFFTMVLAVIGVIFYAQHWQAPRTRMLAILFIVGAVLFALGGPVTISLLVPMVYLFVAAGLGYLLHEWLQVFPRNPLARGLGFALIGIAVALSCLYNVRSYFVAWPHNAQTKAAFHKTPDN